MDNHNAPVGLVQAKVSLFAATGGGGGYKNKVI